MAEDGDRKKPRVSARVARELGGGVDAWAKITALGRKPGIINLGQGFPDGAGHPGALAGARDALDVALSNQYSAQNGAASLREALAELYTELYGQQASPNNICVVTGGTEAIFAIMQALLDPDDEVIVFEPAFPWYAPCTRLAGGKVVPIRLNPPDFAVPLEAVRAAINPKTRILVFNTPHNPTGHCALKEEVEQLAKICLENDIFAIADEVYESCLFKGTKHFRLQDCPGMADRTLTIGSSSKLLSLTGWRVGWVSGPEDLLEAVRTAHAYATYCAPTPLQEGVARAVRELRADRTWLEDTASMFEDNFKLLAKALEDSGVSVCPAQGGYFLVADVSSSGKSDLEYVQWLADERNVCAVPLSVCYTPSSEPPPALVRFAICKDRTTIERAAAAIRSKAGV